jgi:hypothetical protein
MHWPALPLRAIDGLRSSQVGPLPAPPWHDSGPVGRHFDFCGQVRRLLDDIVLRTPEFAHVQVPRILLGVIQARSRNPHGLQARVTPLRFQRGALTKLRRGVVYQVQRYFVAEHEFLYLLTFCLPRFLDRDFDDKLVTLVHELWHIGPEFDGDLRRHDGRYQLHTHSRRGYDRKMTGLARAYLASNPDPALHGFLRLNFAQLHERHRSILGVVVPRPRIVPLLTEAAQVTAEAHAAG